MTCSVYVFAAFCSASLHCVNLRCKLFLHFCCFACLLLLTYISKKHSAVQALFALAMHFYLCYTSILVFPHRRLSHFSLPAYLRLAPQPVPFLLLRLCLCPVCHHVSPCPLVTQYTIPQRNAREKCSGTKSFFG
jgi:hypothetical protein